MWSQTFIKLNLFLETAGVYNNKIGQFLETTSVISRNWPILLFVVVIPKEASFKCCKYYRLLSLRAVY